jgi:hypothetical protein
MSSLEIPKIISENILEIIPTKPEIVILQNNETIGRIASANIAGHLGISEQQTPLFTRPYELLDSLFIPFESDPDTVRLPFLLIDPKITTKGIKSSYKDALHRRLTKLRETNSDIDDSMMEYLFNLRIQELDEFNNRIQGAEFQGLEAMTYILKVPTIPFRFSLYGNTHPQDLINYLKSKDLETRTIWSEAKRKNIWTGIWNIKAENLYDMGSEKLKLIEDFYLGRKPFFNYRTLNAQGVKFDGEL